MKKGLSVLLIAAALFGFYGGATSLNDVLASKDYWEEVGEKSTADMNKLEDGLNQLKDNEKAYLDGQKTLAEGEKTLADGEAQYEQGLADYAAAPGKLADARRQIADGEAQLAEGAANLNKLGTAVVGINKILNGYSRTWRPGYETLKAGRKKLATGVNGSLDNLTALSVFAGTSANAYLAALEDVGNDNEKQTAKDYKEFIASTNELEKDLRTIQATVAAAYAAASADYGSDNFDCCQQVYNNKAVLLSLAPLTGAMESQYTTAVNGCANAYQAYLDAPDSSTDPQIPSKAVIKHLINNSSGPFAGLAQAVPGVKGALQLLLNGQGGKPGLIAVSALVGKGSDLDTVLLPGLKLFNSQASEEKIDELADGQDEIAGGIRTIASGVLGNKTLKDGVKKAMGASAIKLLQVYNNNPNPANTAICDFAKFEAQMDKTPGLVAMLQKARGFLGNTIDNGTNEYNAGLKKLNAGKAEYAKGLADYAAAPAKLADAEKQLADGRKQLEDGKKKLAEYEDGEQQVRDGLATLMATEADPGLESILDRRNGDDKFDDANGHLQLDEGLEAVDTGRGYQAESGELITKEVTNRAVGTAAGLGAAALAVLAAILSFLKKNKGAAVSAVLAAVAGGIGAGVGLSAGEYYSDIAGSTIGNTPFIAAAILAVVAAVFAIVHFTAKPEAK